jgi:hypothetical protein
MFVRFICLISDMVMSLGYRERDQYEQCGTDQGDESG